MLPVNEPVLGGREAEYVNECLRSGWISSSGRFIDEFERKWSSYCGMRHGVAMCNGTAALHASVACLRMNPGDAVIMPTFTIISCALAVLYNGGQPLLVDSDPLTWTMDVTQLERRIGEARRTHRVRAIMAVHIYGHPVDMDPVRELAERYNIAVVEDAAEAHGAEYLCNRESARPEWKRCGGLGDISVFSFYANKPVTTGEGGMLLTQDDEYADAARRFRNLCFEPGRRFQHRELGHNFRMTNLQAAIGVAQVERIQAIIAKKRLIGAGYSDRLSEIDGVQLPVEMQWAKQIYWMYGIVLDPARGMDAETCARKLSELAIETRPFFLGMHAQPVLQEKGFFRGECYPVADRIARYGLYLPSGLSLTDDHMDQVTDALRKVLA
jgi:perosamine synthetase